MAIESEVVQAGEGELATPDGALGVGRGGAKVGSFVPTELPNLWLLVRFSSSLWLLLAYAVSVTTLFQRKRKINERKKSLSEAAVEKRRQANR